MDTHMVAAGNNMLPTKPTQSPVASASSSPSHEFSFTISLHHSSSTSLFPDHTRSSSNNNNKAKTSPLAIDLSPADDIFFHGHLLPLQFLSHLPVSPRSSTNSLDSFTLPIRDFVVDDHRQEPAFECSTSIESNNNHNDNDIVKKKSNSSSNIQEGNSHNGAETSGRTKAKSFSIFGLQKRRKEQDEDNNKQGMNKQKRFDVSNILKRYARMMKIFTGRKENHVHFSRRQQQQPHSFSGDLSPRNRQINQLRGMRAGEFSAPASMRTSPTNSGLLRATSGASTPSNTNDSTMEELQAAIQAAIAHCKNSSATEEKIKCLDN